nr:MAG TPA: hypothetical protein [Caudoviricetes sp.]
MQVFLIKYFYFFQNLKITVISTKNIPKNTPKIPLL